jgi:hypothetical protein
MKKKRVPPICIFITHGLFAFHCQNFLIIVMGRLLTVAIVSELINDPLETDPLKRLLLEKTDDGVAKADPTLGVSEAKDMFAESVD